MTEERPTRVVVAGVGNTFLADDGFGPAVIAALRSPRVCAPGLDVVLVDAGVRTMHLAYDIADDVDLLVVADLAAGASPPPAVTVLELTDDEVPDARPDGHGMGLDHVLSMSRRLGAGPGHVLVVGCAPVRLDECVGLSPDVALAVEATSTLIRAELPHWAAMARRHHPAPAGSDGRRP